MSSPSLATVRKRPVPYRPECSVKAFGQATRSTALYHQIGRSARYAIGRIGWHASTVMGVTHFLPKLQPLMILILIRGQSRLAYDTITYLTTLQAVDSLLLGSCCR